MKLAKMKSVLMLDISNGRVKFREEWIEKLRALPSEEFGEFIRLNVYPALSDLEKRLWNRSQISNKDLLSAIQTFV